MEKIFLSGYIVNNQDEDDRRGIYAEKWFPTYDDAEKHVTRKAGLDNDSEHSYFVFEAVAHVATTPLPVTITKL